MKKFFLPTIFIILILGGLLFFWFGGQISHLTCVRQNTDRFDCLLERRYLNIFTTSTQKLIEVTEAMTVENCTDDCYYWLEIQTVDGPISFTPFTSFNQTGVIAKQEEINHFLQNRTLHQFQITGSPSWVLMISGVPLIFIGGILFWQIYGKSFKT